MWVSGTDKCKQGLKSAWWSEIILNPRESGRVTHSWEFLLGKSLLNQHANVGANGKLGCLNIKNANQISGRSRGSHNNFKQKRINFDFLSISNSNLYVLVWGNISFLSISGCESRYQALKFWDDGSSEWTMKKEMLGLIRWSFMALLVNSCVLKIGSYILSCLCRAPILLIDFINKKTCKF